MSVGLTGRRMTGRHRRTGIASIVYNVDQLVGPEIFVTNGLDKEK